MTATLFYGVAVAISGFAMFLLAIAVLPRLDYFSLRQKSNMVRIPASRRNATVILIALVAAPPAALWWLFYRTSFGGYEVKPEDLLPFGAALPVYMIAINGFVSQAEYILVNYQTGIAKIRLNGLAGLIPISSRVPLSQIGALRRARQTSITSDKDGVSSSTSHTLAISGTFGARDLAFESAAVRDFAVSALQLEQPAS